MIWYHISLLLCSVGFLKEIRPSEPFVTDYMQEPYRDVTKTELNRYVFPVATYSNLILSVAILLVTDWLRYKPIISLMGLSGIVTWTLLLWTKSFFAAQMTQVSYALYTNCEVAYFAYIYAKVSKDHFQAVSSHTRAALLAGRFTSGILSQSLRYFGLMDIHTLNYLTLSAQIVATLMTIFLPNVNESLYFYRNPSSRNDIINGGHNSLSENTGNNMKCDRCQQAFNLMWTQLKCAYTNQHVILWSIWYACGMCICVQFLTYVQSVWIEIDNREEVMWNGAIEAISTLSGAAVTLLASRLHANLINTNLKVLFALCTMSLCASAAIFLTANVSSRFVSYIGYLLFYVFYNFTITVSSAEIAKELPEDTYGLIFGVNAFFAYCMQSILTAIVASDSFSLHLNIFQQMNVYGGFFTAIGCVYLILLIIFCFRSNVDDSMEKPELSDNNGSNIDDITIHKDCINSL